MVQRGAVRTAAAAITVVLAVSGCSADTQARVRAVGAAAASTTSPPAPTQAPPDVHGHTDEDEQLPPPERVPTWDAASRASAAAAAERAMRSFARPRLDAARWWAQLEPLLSPAAALAYQGTDPANVPARKVTGKPVLVDESSAYLARVKVPTDAGRYVVLLAREGAGEPWLVERITPPAASGP